MFAIWVSLDGKLHTSDRYRVVTSLLRGLPFVAAIVDRDFVPAFLDPAYIKGAVESGVLRHMMCVAELGTQQLVRRFSYDVPAEEGSH